MKRWTSLIINWVPDVLYAIAWQVRSLLIGDPPAHYHTDAATKAPVILIPGIYETWHFLKPVADGLVEHGHAVYVIDALGYHTMDIPDAAAEVRNLIERLDLSDVTIIGHSKGGLVGKYVLAFFNEDERVKQLVAIATPFSGSTYADYFRREAIKVFSPQSELIQRLLKQEHVNDRIYSLYPLYDYEIPQGSHLRGAHNQQLAVYGHFKILRYPQLFTAILAILDQESTSL